MNLRVFENDLNVFAMRSTRAICIGTALIMLLLLSFPVGAQNAEEVAHVNGVPITQEDFLKRLVEDHGTQVLDAMINETLIIQEAEHLGVAVDEAQVDAQLSEIRGRFPDATSWEDALRQDGLSEASLARQIEMELVLERMFADELNVEPEEVGSIFEETKESYPGIEEAVVIDYIANQLRHEKLQLAVSDLLGTLHANSVINVSLDDLKLP